MFVTFGIQHAMRMHRIILSSVACPAVRYFSTLSHDETINKKKKKLLNLRVKYVFWFSLQLVWNISHSKKNWARFYQKSMLVFM